MNNVMLAMTGLWEMGVILLILLGMALMAAAAAVLLVWWLRRNETPSASPANPPTPRPTPPPSPSAHCPRCGAAMPPESPQGLCPRCVLGVGLDTQTEATGEFGPHGTKTVPPPEAEVARRFPNLEILGCLGHGGMGVVYKARQPKLNRPVALKILAPEKGADPEFAERFLREAQALARLSHPNIVTVHDFGEADGMFFLLMEYVDGMTLRQLLREGLMKPEAALVIVPPICEALQFAHEQGVVHRDIKPENVLLDKQGRVKIADFGIAKLVGGPLTPALSPSDGERMTGRPGQVNSLTQDQIIGTPHYMAPEQVEKPQWVDHRADIYSLGVVFYEMLTGELPLGRFQPPSKKVQVDVRLDEVVLHALEKEPDRRYQHASEVKADVETIAGNPTAGAAATATPAAARASAASRARGPKRLSRMAALGAVWATFVILPLLVWFVYRVLLAGTPPQPEWWQTLLMAALLPLGMTAPFGTTILGCIAIYQIRRGSGRLFGLRLAVFDALLFPLLALNGGLVAGWSWLADQVGPEWIPQLGRAWFSILVVGLMVTICVVASWLIIWTVWRAARKPIDGKSSAAAETGSAARSGPESKEPDRPLGGRSWYLGILAGLALLVGLIARGSVIASFPVSAEAVPEPEETQWLRDQGADLVLLLDRAQGQWGLIGYSINRGPGLWSVSTGELLTSMPHDGVVTYACFSPDGTTILAADNGTARLWSTETGRPAGLAMPTVAFPGVPSAWFLPETQAPITRLEGAVLALWPAQPSRSRTLVLPGKARSAAFDPSGELLAQSYLNGQINLYASPTGALLDHSIQHGNDVWEIVFTPDGERLLTAGMDGSGTLRWLKDEEVLARKAR